MNCSKCHIEFTPFVRLNGIIESKLCTKCRYKKEMVKRLEKKEVPKEKKQHETKTIAELLKLAQVQFNKYIRTRDTLPGGYFRCPTCSKTKKIEGGNFHACHVFSAGHYPALRFNEHNVFGGCSACNYYKHGESNEFVLWLQSYLPDEDYKALIEIKNFQKHKQWKWDRSEILAIIDKYKALNLQEGKEF